MKHQSILFTFIVLSTLLSCTNTEKTSTTIASAEKGFLNVPDSIRIGCYWYWLSDNISKEGVIKDLHAMKKAGITRAHIGNIGKEVKQYGKVKIFTDEWWDILHAALKIAGELDIEIGMFNSPGWSQSGGPWVKPEQSMRYLASTDVQVKGGKTFTYNFPNFSDSTQLVKVIAYPFNTDGYSVMQKVQLKPDQFAVHIPVDSAKTIRSLVFNTRDYYRTKMQIMAKQSDGTYKTFRHVNIDRSNYSKTVGFNPYAPVVFSLPDIKTSEFYIWFDKPIDFYTYNEESGITLSSEPVVECYPEQSLAKMFQRPDPNFYSYMWEKQDWYDRMTDLAIPDDKVLDITNELAKDGTLTWNAPAGDWTVSLLEMKTTGVTNMPATPDATGLEVDKLSKKHIDYHFDKFMGEILRRIPAEDRKSLKYSILDSYETGGQNWTDDMYERFKKVYGYDPLPYLPAMYGKVVVNEDVSERFLWDLRRLVADGIAYDYVGGLTESSHKHGLRTWLENYGHWGFPGEFLMYGGQSDEVAGEFWSVGELGDIENRAASSAAHIYGKKRVWSESFTSGGPNYHRYPAEMKARADRFFTEGINATLLHVYIHQPYEDKNPGMSAWFGNDFNRKNTWFSQIDEFTGYLRSCNWMLQQGKYVADVAYFIGEDAPKMTGVTDPKLPKGYSFDYINAEVLMTRATVKDGYLTLPDGMRYRLLVLPNQKSMRPELLRKIGELVSKGLAVYGDAPEYSPSLQNYPDADNEVRKLGSELFATRIFGDGKVYKRGTSMQRALFEVGARPDFKTTQDSVLFIHRELADGDIYFLSNQTNKKIFYEAEFRVSGNLQPELWNPVTKEIRPLTHYRRSENGISLNIEMEDFGSSFIVFRKGKSEAGKENFPVGQTVMTLENSWQVAFTSKLDGTQFNAAFDKLTDWKDNADERIKYFAGTAVYTTTFNLRSQDLGSEIYIDLGKVMVMAKVKLNGEYVGGVWTTPYRVNVTDFIKTGENTLEVDVVNNWQNCLIGDQKKTENERKTWTVINPFNAVSPLQSSGLLGPVEVQAFDYKVDR